ncbi:carbohydrate ABC transporter permease [Microlunatus soli]|uniref:Carbohydrate ABC transporter membrane protein 1, CUT1 family n=1 Tax=Microlunatus soli TaxID=630515 RepID=A0A1H1XSS4_9ACTN|nr:sugar ABC transporter permease [Microlunatus soli]SDT12308.1 carbohydrate ABC transporter membrane protein 1, CUT1 family [Microlunatus soli]
MTAVHSQARGLAGSAPGDPPVRRRRRGGWRRYEGLVYVAPVFLGIIAFQLIPILVSMYLSLADWNGINPPKFIGLKNFTEMFTNDPLYLSTLRNTLLFTLGAIPTTTVLAFVLALLCNRKVPGIAAFRAAYFAPFITNIVAIGYIWYWIYKPDQGVLNGLLSVVGIDGPAWLSSPNLALISVIVVSVWQGAGYPMVIFLAGLQGIPKDLYESASIDGASTTRQLFKITIPLMTPSIFFVLITQFITSFQVFGVIYIMTQGGPGNSTSVYIYYLYQVAFSFGRYGYAAAMAWVLFVILGVITLIQWRLQKRWVFYG